VTRTTDEKINGKCKSYLTRGAASQKAASEKQQEMREASFIESPVSFRERQATALRGMRSHPEG
jgi:hypothetical protein